MEDKRILKNYRIYILFAILAAAMIVLYPQEGKFQYEYQKGRPWIYETLLSPIDFPILKTDSEMLREKEAKASQVIDYYTYNSGVESSAISGFNKLAISRNVDAGISLSITEHLSEIYAKGIVSSFSEDDISDKVILVKKNKRVEEVPAAEVYTVNSTYNFLKEDIAYSFPGVNIDSLDQIINLKSFIIPNLIYDESTSQLLHKEAVDYISPTKGVVYAGQLIVSKGELVTADIAQLLDSFKAEYKLSFGYTGSQFSLISGHVVIVSAIVALLFITILFANIQIFTNRRKLIFILMLFLISYLFTVFLYDINPQLLYLFPYATFVLYTISFFKSSSVFPIYLITLLPVMVIADNGVELFMINSVAGAILLLTFSRFSRGWMQFLNVAFVYAGVLAVYISFKLCTSVDQLVWQKMDFFYLAINAVSVIVLYPFVYLFEKIFALVSYSRLWEMTDTNNPLLQELAHKTPGTFQHSIQVANLAENAAREIGADSMLVRVGAMYHDIGKMDNPMCFIENQAPGVEYHKDLSPMESARDIIRHVDDGVALAKKFNLPDVVIDFIKSHHGRSQTLYFYNKYCNEGGDPQNKAPFTYDGILPETKEQVILMMADAVEAASRSLKSYTTESISTLVDNILSSRLSDSQLINADISIKDVNTVKESFKKYISQIYHSRIVYPKRKINHNRNYEK